MVGLFLVLAAHGVVLQPHGMRVLQPPARVLQPHVVRVLPIRCCIKHPAGMKLDRRALDTVDVAWQAAHLHGLVLKRFPE